MKLSIVQFWHPQDVCQRGITFRKVPSLKLTAKAPENRPKRTKRKESSSNDPFSGAKMLVSGRANPLNQKGFTFTLSCLKKSSNLAEEIWLWGIYIYTRMKKHQKRKGNSHRFAGCRLG